MREHQYFWGDDDTSNPADRHFAEYVADYYVRNGRIDPGTVRLTPCSGFTLSIHRHTFLNHYALALK